MTGIPWLRGGSAVLVLLALLPLAGCLGATKTPGSGGPGDDAGQEEPGFVQLEEDDASVRVEVEESTTSTGEGGPSHLRVRIEDPSGRPVPGMRVSLLHTDFFATTNETGEVRFDNVTPDAYGVRMEPEQWWYRVLQVNVTVKAAAVTVLTVIAQYQPGLISPPHEHDAWQGRTRFELFSVAHDVTCAPFQSYCYDTTTGKRTNQFRFPTGAIVPIGTARMNVTVTWTSIKPTSFYLQIEGPGNIRSPLSFASSGQTHTLDLLEKEWDAPHAESSVWYYVFTADIVNRQGVWENPTVTVFVERMVGPLPINEPHPDLWGEETVRYLAEFNETKGPETAYAADTGLNVAPWHTFDSIVMPGTKELVFRAWVNHTGLDQDMELWYDPLKQVSTQTGGTQIRKVEVTETNGVYEWRLPIPSAWWDPIYRKSSQWGFRFTTATDDDSGVGNGGYGVHAIVEAHKA